MQRTRPATGARRRRRPAAPAPPVVVATHIFAVEGELLATMDAVASRRVLKRDIQELTRLILVGGERREYGPAAIPNLSRVGSYRPLPLDYEAQAIARNANGTPGAASTFTKVGAIRENKPQVATATFVPQHATGNGTNGNGTNGHPNGNTNGHTNGHAVAAAPAPAPGAPPAGPVVPPGPLPVSRVVDGKVVPVDPLPQAADLDDLSGSALSSIDANLLFGTFEADAALGGGWATRA